MRIECASAEHQRAFDEWSKCDRLEIKTYRPIIDGKIIPGSDQATGLARLKRY
ncbi:hypothetical protein [Nostoc sp.]|uniref:hypothetical protein n=1 Tax=Nostoc sp. TaxID=1180 RepID=UPI002FFAE5A6